MELICSNLKCRLPASDKLLFDWFGNPEIDNRELSEWMGLFVGKIPKLNRTTQPARAGRLSARISSR